MNKKNHKVFLKFLFIYFLIGTGALIITKLKSYLSPSNELYTITRRLLQLTNCTPHSIEEFPDDFMTRKQREQGGIIFHIIVSIYLFMALAIICDEYFVSSLEKICEVLNIKRDVAGATFMAAGSSAPELCTSVIGVFVTKSDVGVSTIVGSAVFNVLCIIAICGIFAGMVIHLTWWPMFRDCTVYCLTIIILIIIISDDIVHWYEALIMIIMYLFYIVLLYYNDKVQQFISNRLHLSKVSQNIEYAPLLVRQRSASLDLVDESDEEDIMESGDVNSNHSRIIIDEKLTNLEPESTSVFEIPNSFCQRLYWVTMLPITAICYLTIPDCRKPGCWKNLFFLTFIMSVVWISLTTYVLVWMTCLTGDTWGIPDTVMGLTILAAGTSIPDALSGFLVAKEGHGDMSISNSIGSNIFDILVCLGLPWIIKTGFISPGEVVQISSSGLLYTTITLLSTVAILIGTVMINKWRLTRLLGFIFLFLYFAVITFACLYETDVFGKFSLPPCPRARM